MTSTPYRKCHEFSEFSSVVQIRTSCSPLPQQTSSITDLFHNRPLPQQQTSSTIIELTSSTAAGPLPQQQDLFHSSRTSSTAAGPLPQQQDLFHSSRTSSTAAGPLPQQQDLFHDNRGRQSPIHRVPSSSPIKLTSSTAAGPLPQQQDLFHSRPLPQQTSSTADLFHSRPLPQQTSSTADLFHDNRANLFHSRPLPQQQDLFHDNRESHQANLFHSSRTSSTAGLFHDNRVHYNNKCHNGGSNKFAVLMTPNIDGHAGYLSKHGTTTKRKPNPCVPRNPHITSKPEFSYLSYAATRWYVPPFPSRGMHGIEQYRAPIITVVVVVVVNVVVPFRPHRP
ncbi:hypothetical protein ACRALDRAFT_2022062 [Sodiomyces alcalophilus JCM 7366]|uniref:uncharacterized protein n=1 Tax=Sodiomyces alcalophilus JCM 7366 TaxID=591952 RepID=UPI0039B3B807